MRPLQTVRVLPSPQHERGGEIGVVLEERPFSTIVLFPTASEGHRFQAFDLSGLEPVDVMQEKSFVPPADRPYHHVTSESHGPAEPDAPAWVHTWRHVETGAEIVATFPPFSWEDLDGLIVLRHVRDVAHVREAYPSARVTERP